MTSRRRILAVTLKRAGTRSLAGLVGLLLVTALLGHPVPVYAGWDPDRVSEAKQAINEFRTADPGLARFFKASHAYAVFPTVGKGGFGIGGAYGKGLIFKGGKTIGEASLTQLTIGFQLGGQAYSEIIFFRDKATLDAFTQGNFELSAQASAVAATYGASADADYDRGVAVFTLARGGLMYEASVGGQKFSYSGY